MYMHQVLGVQFYEIKSFKNFSYIMTMDDFSNFHMYLGRQSKPKLQNKIIQYIR